ncbi:MAG: response regulator [Lachnospiraceae bacterium]|uniref:hemerythrin domain-containing protein n=1 Tax=uncultured Acetatifactor sp. TaxID=1671927 RepID=UPI0026219327|nr:hemerythrin domain-containing protein [uncultured Acetatifactor sp.]MCI8788766.1 response regulator [Lachnospiraceae bacterium]
MGGKQFVWQDRFNIGVDVIDREHRKLFTIMNKLLSYDENDEKSRWAYQEGIKFFKGHTMKHFAEEELYMASIGYEGYDVHRHIHDNFRKKTLPEIEKELAESYYSPEAVNHFLGVCAGWLIGHTLTEDRAIVGGATSKWSDLLPAEEQVALRDMILRMLSEMFQLDARVISESYGGEKFGKGIYYRLLYGTEKGDRWEFFLVFEEKLLVNTVGKIIGSESDGVNVMLLNATRYTAKQFVERIKEQFPLAEQYEIMEENLLTFEQFESAFGKRNLQSSLLFNTGEGYFAFCVAAPHLLKESLVSAAASASDTAPAIKAENAMAEVEKYLENNVEEEKKKILVVDDSSVILQAMKELLYKDYAVSTAKSGLAAIRSMTLDKPDLVLLDYEMPVCDGKQILEMIRAEEELAGIPVIFLTGRGDKESVKNVIALRPAGYLVKSMKPEEIKGNIDMFFEKMEKIG